MVLNPVFVRSEEGPSAAWPVRLVQWQRVALTRVAEFPIDE